MNRNELKRKSKDELIDIILALDNKNHYKDGAALVYREILKNKEKEIEKLLKDKDDYIHETCEAIRDEYIYQNGTKEYDCDYSISVKKLNAFLCKLEGVEDDWVDEIDNEEDDEY